MKEDESFRPDLEHAKTAVLNSLTSASGQPRGLRDHAMVAMLSGRGQSHVAEL